MDINALMNFNDNNGTTNVVYPITKKANVIGLEQDLTNMASAINSASTAVEGKVDKVTGKGLSTEDFTTAEKQKLAGIEAGATVVTVDSSLSSTSENPVQNKVVNTALGNKVDKITGKGLSQNDFTDAYKADLDGLDSALDGKADVEDLTVLVTTVGGKADASYVNIELAKKVDKVTGKELSANDFTDVLKNKLDGIEAGANAYVHPTTSGNKHIPSGGSDGKILRWAADGTAEWGDDHNTEYSDATISTHGLMSAADKAKLSGISAEAEKMYDIDVSKLANFDPDDISVALNSLVLTQGKRVYLPYGEYNVRNPIVLHAPDFCTFHLFGRIQNYVNDNCFTIGGSFCEFVFDDLRSGDIGTAILVNKNFSYSRLRFRYIDHFANGLVFKMGAGREDFVQYSKINFEYISNIVNKCIHIDGSTHDGWVNENTFVGGRLKGGDGIYIEGGTTETGVGFDGNKFYNIGFEEIENNGVYINGETYSNAFLHCRAMEGIGTLLINEVSEQLGHNQYYFDCVVPNDKIVINGHRSTYHGTIANQYTQWIAGGKDKDGLLPHNARETVRYTDVDKTEVVNANGNKKVQYGIPGVERYEPIAVCVKSHSTQDGSDYRYTDVKITNFDKENGLFDVVYGSTLEYAVELHMTFRIIYKWIG